MARIVVLPRAALAGLSQARIADRVLSDGERHLWRDLPRAERQDEWLAGRLAAKLAIRQTLRYPVASWPLEHIEVLRDESGAPNARVGGVSGPSVSIAHTDRLAVAAVSALGHVGVDVERIRSLDFEVARHMLTEREQLLAPSFMGGGRRAVTGMWAIKEASLKALGVGLQQPPTSIEIRLGPELQVSVERTHLPNVHVAQAWIGRWDDHMLAAVVLTLSRTRVAVAAA
jgi:phosphopantetheinyl transferase (holo-ACP synthase)